MAQSSLSFPGFPKAALTFFKQLKRNNNRDWFNENKDTFETQVKAPMEALVEALNARLAGFAPAYITEPRKAVYRIYRDTRFSPDKTPYKTHTGALFRRADLPKHESGAFYVGISHEEVGVAGGVYMVGPEQLRVIRAHLAERYEDLEKMLRGAKMKNLAGDLMGESLQRPPKGYAPAHPAAHWIKKKQWHFYKTHDAALATTPRLVATVADAFEVMAPVVDFFNEAFEKRPGTQRKSMI